MKIIVIDPGHGGRDPGAVAAGLRESDINLKVSKGVQRLLADYDCKVHMIREIDIGPNINTRTAKAKSLKADAYLCVHNNAGGGTGFEAWYWHTDNKAKAFATELDKQVKKFCKSRGIKASSINGRNFGACRTNAGNGIPAVLVEGFFIDTASDRAKFDTDAKLNQFSIAYTTALVNFLGLKKKSEPVKPTPTPCDIYVVKTELNGYTTADNAKKRISAKVRVKVGNYYVYRIYDGMINVTKVSGSAGSWINPSDNMTVTTPTPKPPVIAVGSVVKIKQGARTYDGKKLAKFVYARKHKVKQLKGDRAVVTYLGIVIAAVNTNNLYLA